MYIAPHYSLQSRCDLAVFSHFIKHCERSPSVLGGHLISINILATLLHIAPFCEGPNKKPEGFAKEKQPAIFAMRHALHLVVHHPSLIYTVPYNHRSIFATYTTKKTLRPAQSPSTLVIFHILQCLVILKTSHILRYKTYR
jgi:hypothetical protein